MQTRVIRSLYNVKAQQQGGVLTIGNFDGVHVGHQQLIKTVIQRANDLNVPSTLITFEPHAFEFFAGDNPSVPRLTRLREKIKAIGTYGMQYVTILQFNQWLAEVKAEAFLHEIMLKYFKPQRLILGNDFHFGYKREGDIALLQRFGKQHGFEVEVLETVEVEGERVSSTRVRQALGRGDLSLAKTLLGRAYSMQGRVRGGDRLGRELGFPTANIFLHRKLTPISGIFTVYMHGIDKKPLPGVANIGIRPTVNGTKTLLEVHLLDFNKDIYGRYVEVEFCQKLRDEVRYPNLDLLKAQIHDDVMTARHYFENKK